MNGELRADGIKQVSSHIIWTKQRDQCGPIRQHRPTGSRKLNEFECDDHQSVNTRGPCH